MFFCSSEVVNDMVSEFGSASTQNKINRTEQQQTVISDFSNPGCNIIVGINMKNLGVNRPSNLDNANDRYFPPVQALEII